MAQELAKLRRFLGNMPAGVCGGWLSKTIKTAAPHPGGWLRFHLAIQILTLPDSLIKHEIIAPLELTVAAATQALGITRAARSTLLNERANLSPEMALRVEKAFGVSIDTLMRMQNSFDIARTRKREGEIRVARYDRAIEGIGSARDAVV